jgi:hypothetical protein
VRYGLVFWYTMLAMAFSGIAISILIENWVLLLTGLITIYMLFTGRNALTRRWTHDFELYCTRVGGYVKDSHEGRVAASSAVRIFSTSANWL